MRVEAEVKEHSGWLFTLSTFNRMKKCFVRIHNQFLYIYPSLYSEAPSTVVSMEKATVSPWVSEACAIVESPTRRTSAAVT